MLRFLYRYGGWLFLAYMVGGGLFLSLIESVFNGGFAFSVKILWFPFFILIFGFTWMNRRFFCTETKSRFKPWLLAALLYPLTVLMGWPYVMVLNSVTARGDKLVYRGPVVRKWIHHGGRRYGDTQEVDVRDERSSEVITTSVTPERYAGLALGESVTIEYMRGGFGIPYRWRWKLHKL